MISYCIGTEFGPVQWVSRGRRRKINHRVTENTEKREEKRKDKTGPVTGRLATPSMYFSVFSVTLW